MRTSMITAGSFSAVVMALALATAPGSFAQSNAAGGGAGSGLNAPANPTVPPSLGSGVMQAPVGHLQPRRDPNAVEAPYQATAEEKALDRKIKSICRGC
ncbi:hypothetical protein OCA5_c20000 [Afipia carboxidovorans OM5]|uniref:Uncharacterized protein n=1 Tax=Afipia carboxidovorans (strain ATCC 49405 / DSM 1227 / KCTC 32145 / OM5) TaxID=504832 RepID=F8BVK2_AFIC5|nr:hypothetical protein [Afipia carboxidovorans]AEI03130.1 hypothetical protein OCA4_c19990 [Afipia carboxidovorans OM4]AEI06707.1 hypothetical protein OCA5_c20000 [Afipia carboxidovorans OM5]BEV43890.1 hypothetical protein CRBSH125_00730 [Afipia carboxidovorans]